MEPLRICLLGGLEVCSGARPVSSFATQKSSSLFGFLILHRDRRFHRDVLCGHFWGDHPDTEARKALRTALWRIRSVLEPDEPHRGRFLRVEGQWVGIHPDGVDWVDADELEAAVRTTGTRPARALTPDDAGRLAHAVSLYRGDLLEGNYDEWCLAVRERLKLALLLALERLVEYHRGRREWLEAVQRGREILRLDPLREHVHRAIMRSQVAMGDRPSALRQYESLVEILRRELDIDPMEESRQLFEAARLDGGLPGRSPQLPSGETWEGSGLAASQVEETLAAVYALARRLEQARDSMRA